MATKQSKIAELVVGFVVQGAREALTAVKQTVAAVATTAKYVAGLGALIQGGILFKAAEGTQEAYEFSKSLEYLVRVLGQALAPYLRMTTVVIVQIAAAFRSLSADTQRWVAVIGLGAMAIAVVLALAPAFATAWTVAAIAISSVFYGFQLLFAALLSPIGLTIAAVAGLVLAFRALFNYITDGGASAANSLNDSNKAWVDRAITWIQLVARSFGNAFNWMMRQAAKASDWIAEKLADAGEYLGILPDGTAKTIRQMEPIEPFKLDTTGFETFFTRIRTGALAVTPFVKGIFGGLEGLLGELLNPSNPQGFTMRMKVEIEGLQQTYDRLLKGFAEGDGEDLQRQILDQNKQFNEKLDALKNSLVNGLEKLGRDFGVVGP
jgi:hypothetical protein